MAKRRNTGRKDGKAATDVTSRQGEDGSFEFVVGHEPGSAQSRRTTGDGDGSSGLPWMMMAAIVAVVVVFGVAVAAFVGGGDEDGDTDDESIVEEAPGFRPYAGGGVSASSSSSAQSDELQRTPRAPQESRREEHDERRQRQQFNEFEELEVSERNILAEEPDGVEVLEDRYGEPIGQHEATERLERELDSIENVEHDFQRRLRRRDIEAHSRVLRPGQGELGAEVIPGIEISEDVQRRIQEQFSHRDSQDNLGVGVDEYRRDDGSEDEEYYDEEYYDEYYDDEYYDEEYYLD